MKPSLLAFGFLTIAAAAFAQGAGATSTPQTSGASRAATGTITMSGCITGGGAAPITMMNPTFAPGATQPGTVSAAASAAVIPPGGTVSLGAAGTTRNGYRLTGTDLTSWIGRRAQVTGTVAPVTPGAKAAAPSGNTDALLQEFRVQTISPLSGECPQRQ